MNKALKNIGVFVIAISLTAVIFWLVFLDKESQEIVLEHSLNMLGNRLLAMVPDGAEKGGVKQMYDNFVKQASAREVEPEQVEQVAASILNLSQLDTVITPEQAMAVLRFSLEAPVKIERIDRMHEPIQGEAGITADSSSIFSPRDVAEFQEKWESLGERIHQMYQFNHDVTDAIKNQAKQMRENQLQLFYRVDDGMRVVIDPQLKAQLNLKKHKQLSRKIRRMEQQELLQWRGDFQKEMEQLRRELRSLKRLKALEQLENLKHLENLQALKALNSLRALEALESLKFVPPIIKVDSIREAVRQSLKDAGIKVENEK
ncbi:MAG TPA: hypothetical protein ENN22_05520 [bacterium]|nr:hypothetical protein [bacterium]